MRARITAVLASTLFSTLLLVAPAHATFPGANGQIAYSSCGQTDCGIFVVEPDGSGATQITHNPYVILTRTGTVLGRDWGPEWSPDGRRIAFTRDSQDGSELRIVNADGTADSGFGVPGVGAVFSPDGTKFAFVDYIPPGYPQIFVMNADGSGVTQLTYGSGASEPDWSPDGTKIAFSQGPVSYGRSEIYVMNADGTGQMRLTFELEQGSWTFGPSWSPNGINIAFTRTYQGQQYEVYSMKADGSGLVNLTDNYVGAPDYTRNDDESPAWSPDGTQIAFVRHTNSGGGDRIVLMNADGSGAREVVAGQQPVWQPLAGPRRNDYKNVAQFCKAERDFLGEPQFRQKYGTGPKGANAHGKCVSGQ
jgi:Tol biopolymer transport system component